MDRESIRSQWATMDTGASARITLENRANTLEHQMNKCEQQLQIIDAIKRDMSTIDGRITSAIAKGADDMKLRVKEFVDELINPGIQKHVRNSMDNLEK